MPQVILPSIRDTDNPELKYQYLYDAYVKLRKELSYLLGNLDSDNVLEAQSVIADWVYAGTVTTDQLIAGEAKIGTALIEDLVVGGNVAMGDNATISWSKVTNQPSIPTYAEISNISTTITANYVATPNLITNIARVNSALELGQQGDNGAKTLTFHAGASSRNSQIISTITDGYSDLEIKSASITLNNFDGAYIYNLKATSSSFFGTANFSNATVLGLNFAPVNHNHDNSYVKTSQDVQFTVTAGGIYVHSSAGYGSIMFDT